MWHSQTMEYYSSIKIHATTWMNFTNMMCERSQTLNYTYYIIPVTQNSNLWWRKQVNGCLGMGEMNYIGDPRKLLGVLEMFNIMIVVMVSQIYTCGKTYQIMHWTHTIYCRSLFLHKVVLKDYKNYTNLILKITQERIHTYDSVLWSLRPKNVLIYFRIRRKNEVLGQRKCFDMILIYLSLY